MSGDPGLTQPPSDPNFVTSGQVQMNGHVPPPNAGHQPSFDEFGSAMNNDMVSIFTCNSHFHKRFFFDFPLHYFQNVFFRVQQQMGNQPQLNDPMSNMGPQGMTMNNQVSNGNLLLHQTFFSFFFSIWIAFSWQP